MEAKACHVTSSAECALRCGLNKNPKMVSGIMMAVDVVTNAQTNHLTTFIVVAYDLGGTMIKTARLKIWSIKALITETGITATTAQGTAVGDLIGDLTVECSPSNNGIVPELAAAPSDDRTTTESTETVATPAEEPPASHLHQHNCTAAPHPVAVAHEQKWFEDDAATRLLVKGNYSYCNWAVKTCHNDMISKGGDINHLHSLLHYFLMSFHHQNQHMFVSSLIPSMVKVQRHIQTQVKF